LGWWTGGALVDAEYDLEGKRVAVVCVSESSAFGPGTDSLHLARRVGTTLSERVEDIDVVPPDEIADWVDRNDWDEMDFAEIGRGVDADMVIGIELSGLKLYEGQTLYKGRANLAVRALDMSEGGKVVFRRKLPEVAFPANGAYPTTDTSESKFRIAFVRVLADRAAAYFYDHEHLESFHTDPPYID
jgi:hypothetical protein